MFKCVCVTVCEIMRACIFSTPRPVQTSLFGQNEGLFIPRSRVPEKEYNACEFTWIFKSNQIDTVMLFNCTLRAYVNMGTYRCNMRIYIYVSLSVCMQYVCVCVCVYYILSKVCCVHYAFVWKFASRPGAMNNSLRWHLSSINEASFFCSIFGKFWRLDTMW